MDNGRIVHRGAMAELAADDRAAKPPARPQPGFASMSALDAGAALPRRRIEILPALTPLLVAARRRAVHRLALDLRDADRGGARDGHDDLHHGLGPHPRLRHDGRAQFRPRRLHRARRLCRDAGAPAARRAGRAPIRLRSTSPSSCLAVVAAALVCGALGWVFERLIVKPVYGQHLKQILATIGGSIIAEQLLYALFGPDADPARAAEDVPGLVRVRRGGDREISRAGDAASASSCSRPRC